MRVLRIRKAHLSDIAGKAEAAVARENAKV